MNNKKTGLYIHIPFCIKKCAYCDFVSYENVSGDIKEDYISAVIKEMSQYRGEEIDTVYFGGGTPTSIDVSLVEKLLNAAKANFSVLKDAEITIECNPKTADRRYFEELKKIGFNRLSIGVQSLNDDELKCLGRVHTSREAIECITYAKEAGFDNFSVDVMFAIPNQTTHSLKNTLDKLISLSPSHISCYSLIIEPGTLFFENGIKPLDDETERQMQDFIVEHLEKHGYLRYEISNFAKDGKTSRHNTKYWELTEYIGLGAAASSYFGGERYDNHSSLSKYIQNPKEKINRHIQTKEDEMSEFMFLGLRKTEGVSLLEFFEKFGIDIEEKFDIEKNIKLGLLIKKDGRLYLSKRGIDVSNVVLTDFV